MCFDVCINWLKFQVPIGGDGIIVEIDETSLGIRKIKRGPIIPYEWIFCGIERESKRSFAVPLVDDNISAHILIELIIKFIKPNSIIVSKFNQAYGSIGNHNNYKHWVCNNLVTLVNDDNANIHMKTIDNFIDDLKKITMYRRGARAQSLKGCMAQYLFVKHYMPEDRFHVFFQELAKIYPPLLYQKTEQGKLFNFYSLVKIL